ncbi:PD-(D/E)XK motif protein [Rhizobium leguminosarum]|uniref:PD-(D/E)XK motif protein n=1 Tax=Rhizobium leguminosarum TaxID=384 RepID=UPI001C9494D3|nr:PD-(D/E)XK motif protein [Rhizobium leguminosarum]MBY5502338.1 PD-(D/E)XK motif protein [Rhizobium leguminosarum]
MNTTPDAASMLEEWHELAAVAPGDRLYRTRRLSRPALLDLRMGLREADGAPCLVASAGSAGDSIASFETAGLRLSRAADPGGPLLVLSLEEPSRRDLFAEICSDCVRSVLRREDEGETELTSVLAARLVAWRAFLRDQAGALSRNEIVGLIGELLVLDRLLDENAGAVATWKAPDDGLHDFECRGHGLEVKTGLGASGQLHISTLDQLDDAGLASLHILHVRLVESANGETLGQIATRIEQRLNGERARGAFLNALLRRGLAPGADTNVRPRVACVGIDAYAVGDGFPRLQRSDVALGIADATYQVEVRALVGFAVNTEALLHTFGGAENE